ncbi:nucleotidyltransferase family protein [Spirosoma validum]|uniref:DNA polymerase beta thumb domain-containing protein n=1 Tax=Spirosoma validum TaxID=2771355 RepID=A0A927B1F8_9BACT|nr:hypothetical protein [Spirosoma validum]MBD2753816.1 hypothetical protein [Spirosoma validum]
MDLKTAKEIAITIGNQLKPYCEKINIAGSVRRYKPEVKDIELVCQPLTFLAPPAELFGNPERKPILAFCNVVASLGRVIKGKPDGKYMQIELPTLPHTINLDLFIPEPHDYYRQYAIRTGSADYSARVIAGGWVAKGWCGSDQGLRRIEDCQERITGGKKKWICINPKGEKPPVWESEQEFFDWIGVKWVEPKLRNL